MVEFIAVRCYSCRTCQCIQNPKSRKFACRVCSEKQSVRHVFATSYAAKDIRQVVMQLNMQRQQHQLIDEDESEFRGAGGGEEDEEDGFRHSAAFQEDEIRLDEQGRIIQNLESGEHRHALASMSSAVSNAPAKSRWSQLFEEEDDLPYTGNRSDHSRPQPSSSHSPMHAADPLAWLGDVKPLTDAGTTESSQSGAGMRNTELARHQFSSVSTSATATVPPPASSTTSSQLDVDASTAQLKRKRSLSPASNNTFLSANHVSTTRLANLNSPSHTTTATATSTHASNMTQSKSLRISSASSVRSSVSLPYVNNHPNTHSTPAPRFGGLPLSSALQPVAASGTSATKHQPISVALQTADDDSIDDFTSRAAKRSKSTPTAMPDFLTSSAEQPTVVEVVQNEPDRFSWLDEMEQQASKNSDESHEQQPKVSSNPHVEKSSQGLNHNLPSSSALMVPVAAISTPDTPLQKSTTTNDSRWAWLED